MFSTRRLGRGLHLLHGQHLPDLMPDTWFVANPRTRRKDAASVFQPSWVASTLEVLAQSLLAACTCACGDLGILAPGPVSVVGAGTREWTSWMADHLEIAHTGLVVEASHEFG